MVTTEFKIKKTPKGWSLNSSSYLSDPKIKKTPKGWSLNSSSYLSDPKATLLPSACQVQCKQLDTYSQEAEV
jgi:hypothetical protein